MGDRNGLVYLGSPAVVAASAVAGYICSPTRFDQTTPRFSLHAPKAATQISRPDSASVIPGFPPTVRGRAWFLDLSTLRLYLLVENHQG